jgi:Spy/CpxP family protein refolding chaperone
MKKSMFRSGLAVLTAGALLGGAVSAVAQPRPEGRPDRRGFPPGEGQRSERPFQPGAGMADRGGLGMFQALAVLTPEQRESFRQQMRTEGDQMRGTEEKLREARRELMKAAFAENLNENAVRKHASTIARIEADRTVAMARLLSKIEPPLSSEQRERLQNPPPPGEFGPGRGPALRQGPPPREGDEQGRPRERRRS